MRIIMTWACGAALLTGGAALATPIDVPTENCRGYFFVPITLSPRDGYPEDRTLWFLYDTGASTTHVDPDSLTRVSNRDFSGLNRVDIVDATAGEVTYHRLPARVTELDHLSIALGREIDGILAYEAFGEYLVTLDYSDHSIRLEAGELPRPDGDTVFSARGRDSRPWIDVHFPGRTRRMLIDSGAAQTVLAVNRLDRYPTITPPRQVGASVRFRRIEYRDGARLDGDARLGPFTLPSPQVEEVPETEIIGGLVMQYFAWTFDTDNDRVRIEPIEGAAVEFPPERSLGLAYRPVRDGLQVEAVLDGFDESVDITQGDIVTHWNGRPVRERGCGDLDGASSVTLTRQRDGDSVQVDVPVLILVE
ncbi:MAG: hypothetical protein CMF74_11430 [Maricaulis sp.]|nr:hypothetical protein [Maricaulis sp.]HAQ36421.1 hypothetical protein [Alphaproteobacteria bacterium]